MRMVRFERVISKSMNAIEPTDFGLGSTESMLTIQPTQFSGYSRARTPPRVAKLDHRSYFQDDFRIRPTHDQSGCALYVCNSY